MFKLTKRNMVIGYIKGLEKRRKVLHLKKKVMKDPKMSPILKKYVSFIFYRYVGLL
jgi:hypothetical protein